MWSTAPCRHGLEQQDRQVGGDGRVEGALPEQGVVDAGRAPVPLVGVAGDRELERPELGARGGPAEGLQCYARVCIVCIMAYRAGVVGASGYTGAELLRLLAGHPEIEVVHVTADSNAGATVAEPVPVARAPRTRGLEYAPFDARDLAGLDVVFLGLPHGESQRVVPELVSDGRATSSTSAPTSASPRPCTSSGTASPTPRPSCSTTSPSDSPSCSATTWRAARHVAAPGCYPTAAALALAPLLADGLVEPAGIVVDAMSGVSGRGRGLSSPSLFSEANESVAAYGLLTHRHTGEIE